MKGFRFFFIPFLIWVGCGPATERVVKEPVKREIHDSIASKQAHQLIDWWIGEQKNAPIALVDRMRNKTLNRVDASELRKYLKRKNVPDSIFGSLEDSIRLMVYHRFDPMMISRDIVWVDNDRLRGCRKLGKNAMWDCLRQDYGKTDYYYLSVPLFSADGEWAIMSVNYMEAKGKKSHGGGRLFRRLSKDRWEEVALLTGWGHFE